MTPERLAELRTLAEAATPGPWDEGQLFIAHGHDSLDAAFIAAARQAVPELLAEVERLTAERAVWFDENSRAEAALGRCRALAETWAAMPGTRHSDSYTEGRDDQLDQCEQLLRAAIDGEA